MLLGVCRDHQYACFVVHEMFFEVRCATDPLYELPQGLVLIFEDFSLKLTGTIVDLLEDLLDIVFIRVNILGRIPCDPYLELSTT